MHSVYTVAQINSYIKNMFTHDFLLNSVYVKGEVSNCKYHTSGHIYFTIKDESGVLACVMFAGSRSGLGFKMTAGQKVVVLGSVNVYERDGKYQMYAKEIILDGVGLLYEKYEKLKNDLEDMGMFDSMYKKQIPNYAKKIGIVTAKTGAAVQDIINISRRRNPYVSLILYPALVQGEGAKESIVRGISTLDNMGVDVIIVGRGGGSIEDLWAFNEECVARAIFECNTPVISAVGHETDTTIADYVADMRAPTPSAAAELAVFDYALYCDSLYETRRRLNLLMQNIINDKRYTAKNLLMQVNYLSPANMLNNKRQQLMNYEDRLEKAMNQVINEKRHRVSIYAERLNGLSPLNKLGSGYAFVEDDENRPVRSIEGVETGDLLVVNLTDGLLKATVVEKSAKRRMKSGKGK